MGNETIQNEQCCPRCGAPRLYFDDIPRDLYGCGRSSMDGPNDVPGCDYAAGLRAERDAARDEALRTYDGLVQRAERAEAMCKNECLTCNHHADRAEHYKDMLERLHKHGLPRCEHCNAVRVSPTDGACCEALEAGDE